MLREMKRQAAAKKEEDSIDETLEYMAFPCEYYQARQIRERFLTIHMASSANISLFCHDDIWVECSVRPRDAVIKGLTTYSGQAVSIAFSMKMSRLIHEGIPVVPYYMAQDSVRLGHADKGNLWMKVIDCARSSERIDAGRVNREA